MLDEYLFKINFILIANSLDDPFNILNQGCKICIGPELDPFILHEAPKDFNQVQFRGIFRKIENESSLFLPDRNRALEGFTRMDRRIIHHDNRWTLYRFTKFIETMDDNVTVNRTLNGISV